MNRRKHFLCYKILVASSKEDDMKVCELNYNGVPCFVKSADCVTCHTKKEVRNYLDTIIKKYPFIHVIKQTHKYAEHIFLVYNEELFWNKLGYKREDK